MTFLTIALQVLIVALSIALVGMILLHKSKGGGATDIFGGSMTNSLASTGVAERNMLRVTVTIAVLWTLSIVAAGILVPYSS
ncbi:preprotein translocase subunit SecG [Arthrobacter caoxuetaonis]|uniref:Protein-export membrane protein SecG n=1 Tax=Arthrobacter caoxuetaonis TaxID=2886935 RepID=A0A9X1MGM5_9MICC|nr:preprotein translocase subunit SecG [Arthrobacter caoxuetaonis]MCC3299724.1 preprotein translocase subunit SecG [Arthrobacter caoxuetaonis]USQ59374.1 preprotein translocase subunit SecG [Arthrobacter caoxuetaonis]